MKYTVVLQRENDGGYVATVRALPGCVSQSVTVPNHKALRVRKLRTILQEAQLTIEKLLEIL